MENNNNNGPKEENNVGLDLEKILGEIDDVTDPSSMDKLMAYVDDIEAEDEEFIELLTMRCEGAEIYWEQPWYQTHQRLTLNPKPEKGEELLYRTDPFSANEHEKIVKNWRKFRKKYNVPDKIISLVRWKTYSPKSKSIKAQAKARLFAVAFLSRGLERTKYQVYTYICSHFGGYRKGFFSKVEEKIMEICFYHKPRYVAVILSSLLGRRKRGIYKRIERETYGKLEKKRLKWNLSLATKFVNHLMEHTGLPFEELKNKRFDMQVWCKLEKDMEQSSNYLHYFWYTKLHVQLFVQCDVKLHRLKKRLFKKIRDKARDSIWKVWSDIRWKQLLSDFPDGFTPRFIYRVCALFIKDFKGYLKVPLEDIVEYALQKLKKQYGKRKNRRLKRLTLGEDGKLKPVDFRKTEVND